MTPRRAIAVVGAAVSLLALLLAQQEIINLSFVSALAGGILLGVAAAFTAVRQRRETFASAGVAVTLWIVPVFGVLFLWVIAAWEHLD